MAEADTVEAVTRTELQALGALDRVEGQAALALARDVDSGRALMAAPAMVKQLVACMDALRAQAPKAEDEIDEVTVRRAARRAKRGAAAG